MEKTLSNDFFASLLVAGLVLAPSAVKEANAQPVMVQPPNQAPVPLSGDSNGNFLTTAPNTALTTWVAINCGTVSTPFGVTGTTYLHVQIPNTVVQNIGFGWNGTPATLTPPSEVFGGNVDFDFAGGTGSCIVASGTASITVGYK